MARSPIAVSYCVTCKGRLYQLRETLAGNLAALAPDEEIALVDYASTDGLAPWVWEHHRDDISAGRLRFFRVLGQAPWHAAKAKNLAHRIGQGRYLFSLDADNFLDPADRTAIREAADAGQCCQQGTGDLRDGTPGRIGLPRSLFYRLGGYDEGLLGVLVEDLDLVIRIKSLGIAIQKLAPPVRLPLQNEVEQRLEQYRADAATRREVHDRAGKTNLAMARARRELEGPVRHQNFASYRGRLNGRDVILDGFGNFHRAG